MYANVFSHPYQLDETISNYRVVGGVLHFYSFKRQLCKQNSGESYQTPRFAASDMVLHCLPMSHKKDARLI